MINFTYTPAQVLTLRYHEMYPGYHLHFEAGIGTGKTALLIRLAILKALQHPKELIGIGARDLNQYKSALIPEFENILENEMGLEPGDYNINRVNGDVTILGKHRIIARSAEAYTSHFRAITLGALFCDEVDYWKEAAYTAAVGRVRSGPESFLTFSSPDGYNYVYDLYHGGTFEEVEKGVFISHELKRIRIHAPTWSNTFLKQSYIDNLYRTYDPRRFQQEVAAERLALNAGAVFLHFDRQVHVKPCQHVYTPGKKITFSLDYNVSSFEGNFNIVKHGHIYTLDEIQLKYEDVRAMGEKIIEICLFNKWNVNDIEIIGDAAGNNKQDVLNITTAYQTFKEMGFLVRKAYKPLIKRRVSVANGSLYHKKVTIDPKCKRLIRDLEQVAYNEKGEIDKKDLTLTHSSDGWSYFVWHEHAPKVNSGGSSGTAW